MTQRRRNFVGSWRARGGVIETDYVATNCQNDPVDKTAIAAGGATLSISDEAAACDGCAATMRIVIAVPSRNLSCTAFGGSTAPTEAFFDENKPLEGQCQLMDASPASTSTLRSDGKDLRLEFYASAFSCETRVYANFIR